MYASYPFRTRQNKKVNQNRTRQNNGVLIMPFVSQRQRRFLWVRHPEIARKWADEEKKLKAKKKLKVIF
jgi:hypothetical protein